ncbi:MAG: eCIS core domain-containing protein [Acidimicrobiia bacterium]
MKPALLLAASGISSAQVSAVLDGLDLDQVEIQPAPGWMAFLWGGSVSAMTLGNTVYVTPASLDTDPAKLGPLIVHELVHVHRWAQLGVLRFLWRYLSGYLRGRFTGLSHQDAYRAIPFEVEARQFASQMEGPIGPI